MSLPDAAADVSSAIRSCPLVREAVKLAGTLGTGQPAGTARGREKNRAYPFGIGAGLIGVAGGTAAAVAGVDLAAMDDGELLGRWRAGVRAVCAAETPRNADDGVLLLVVSVLGVLAGKPGVRQADQDFWAGVDQAVAGVAARYGLPAGNVIRARGRYDAPGLRGGGSPGLIELLASFGMVCGDPGHPRITALGQLARDLLTDGMPVAADAKLPAVDLLTQVADLTYGQSADSRALDRIAAAWVIARDPRQAAHELLTAASGMPSADRLAAVHLVTRLGPAALPVWKEFADDAVIGPHARQVLAGGTPSGADRRWILLEYLAADLARGDVDEVLTVMWRALPAQGAEDALGLVAATGHPDADCVVRAVRAFLASGAPRAIDRVLRLKVTLLGTGGSTWRSVLVPATATLAELRDTLGAVFGRSGEYLMDETPCWFAVGDRRYAEPGSPLRDTLADHQIRVSAALSQAERIGYTYDPDACWEHEITLEEALPRDSAQRYPVCVAFSGATPSGYPGLRGQTGPSDLDEANRRLGGLMPAPTARPPG